MIVLQDEVVRAFWLACHGGPEGPRYLTAFEDSAEEAFEAMAVRFRSQVTARIDGFRWKVRMDRSRIDWPEGGCLARKRFHHVLVFVRFARAGRVDQTATGYKDGGRVVQHLALS